MSEFDYLDYDSDDYGCVGDHDCWQNWKNGKVRQSKGKKYCLQLYDCGYFSDVYLKQGDGDEGHIGYNRENCKGTIFMLYGATRRFAKLSVIVNPFDEETIAFLYIKNFPQRGRLNLQLFNRKPRKLLFSTKDDHTNEIIDAIFLNETDLVYLTYDGKTYTLVYLQNGQILRKCPIEMELPKIVSLSGPANNHPILHSTDKCYLPNIAQGYCTICNDAQYHTLRQILEIILLYAKDFYSELVTVLLQYFDVRCEFQHEVLQH